MFLVPAILGVVIVYAWVEHESLSYEDHKFPASVEGFGWFIEVGKYQILGIFFGQFPVLLQMRGWESRGIPGKARKN